MSRHTLVRIPQGIQHILRVYELALMRLAPYQNATVRDHLQKTSAHYSVLNRELLQKLKSGGSVKFHVHDFPPVVGKIIAPIFQESLKQDKLDLMPVDQLLPEPESTKSESQVFISERNHMAKSFTDHQAKIIASFASACSPLSGIPPVKSIVKSFQWYQKLLRKTPVIIFLKQKQRLMSDTNLHSLNRPLNDLTKSIANVASKYNNDESLDKRIRNYHLTDLNTTDIFELAVVCEGTEGKVSDVTDPFFWLMHRNVNDKLCKVLNMFQMPQVIDKNGNLATLTRDTRNKYALRNIRQKLEDADLSELSEIFPYDIIYNDLFMLTIEALVIQDDHLPLLQLLENQTDFEVVAVRISLNNNLLADISKLSKTSEKRLSSGTSYEQLLKMAEQSRLPNQKETNTFNALLEKLGQLGLVEVEEGRSKSSMYLFK